MRIERCSCTSLARSDAASSAGVQGDPRCVACLGRGLLFLQDGQPEADLPNFRIVVSPQLDPGSHIGGIPFYSSLNWTVESIERFRPLPQYRPMIEAIFATTMNHWSALEAARGHYSEELCDRAAMEMKQLFIAFVAQGQMECSKLNPIVVKRGTMDEGSQGKNEPSSSSASIGTVTSLRPRSSVHSPAGSPPPSPRRAA